MRGRPRPAQSLTRKPGRPAKTVPSLLLLGLGLLPVRSGAAQHPAGAGSGSDRITVRYLTVRDPEVVRGLWVTRWEYRSPDEVTALLSRAADYGITDIYFQVRGRADAFYRSNLEPWGSELTGTLGRDPGWDPLEVAVTAAHTRGLRLHAWINTFTMWSGSRPPPPTDPPHIFRAHPEWIMANQEGRTLRLGNRFGYVLAAPANPAVQEHIRAVVLDIVGRYAVDGVHFDYIRLPDCDYSYDAVSRGRFLHESRITDTYLGWQAGEITGLLGRIAEAARSRHPGLILSAAIVNHYHRAVGIFAQDPCGWVESGALDYVVPMMYTPELSEYLDMLGGYLEVLSPERIVAGINLGEMPEDPFALAAQIHHSVLAGVRGHVLFSLDEVDALARRDPAAAADLYAWLEELQGAAFQRAVPAGAASPAAAPDTGEPVPEFLRATAADLLALLARISQIVSRVIR